MDIILLACLIMSAYKINFSKNSFYKDSFSRENTTVISGIFVILVFLSHFSSYIVDDPVIYPLFTKVSGQLIVAPFLLFSGYGVMKSIEHKGDTYIRSFGIKRIFRVWCHFTLAVCVYLAVAVIWGTKYNMRRILLSFIGLSSVGNSNWFMFTLLCVYLMTMISGLILIKRKRTVPFAVAVLIVVFMFVMKQRGMSYYYYDTAFAYAFGMFYELYEDRIQKFFTKNNTVYIACFLIIGVVFIAASLWRSHTHWISSFIVWVTSFCVLLMLFSLKVKSNNSLLLILGRYSFEIYIMQRIPMNLLYKSLPNKYVFFAMCVLITGIISCVFRKLEELIDKYICHSS